MRSPFLEDRVNLSELMNLGGLNKSNEDGGYFIERSP
jgi:hypothetical protein